MAEKNKSIIESALLDAKRIQEALNANTKEILRTVALEEIDGLVKESLEEDYVEEDADEDTEDVEVTDTEAMDSEDSMSDDEVSDVDDTEDFDISVSDDSMEGDDFESGDDMNMSADALGGEEEMDMTMASDDEVISVYKKLTGDDEIEVVVDDESGDIHLSVNEPGDFVIKTNDTGSSIDDEVEMDEYSMDESEEVDEVMYEIALDEMVDIEGTKAPVGSEEDNWAGDNLEGGFDEDKPHAKAEGPMVMHEEDEMFEIEYNEEDEDFVDENLGHTRGYAGRQGARKVGAAHHPKPKNESKKPTMTINEVANKYNTLLTEAKELKGKNEEYKQALKQFRTMLAETVVFNSNLTYVTKLFMEHSTTKEEKQAILKRFDSEATTLKESKRLYKSIVSDLSSRKPMNESIERKLNNEVSSGMSKQLNESTAYIDKETQRIKDLMSRVEKR
jgi:hypothetical protein